MFAVLAVPGTGPPPTTVLPSDVTVTTAVCVPTVDPANLTVNVFDCPTAIVVALNVGAPDMLVKSVAYSDNDAPLLIVIFETFNTRDPLLVKVTVDGLATSIDSPCIVLATVEVILTDGVGVTDVSLIVTGASNLSPA